jgi:MoxR-like ATPase
VLSYEALSAGIDADELVRRIMNKVAAPDKPLETHVRVGT